MNKIKTTIEYPSKGVLQTHQSTGFALYQLLLVGVESTPMSLEETEQNIQVQRVCLFPEETQESLLLLCLETLLTTLKEKGSPALVLKAVMTEAIFFPDNLELKQQEA